MACSLVVFGLAGCGGPGGDGDADPATALPPTAVYVDAVINPEGDQRERMDALLGKLMRTEDPGGKILELLDEGGKTEFKRDVKPWLGRRAGIAFTGFEKEEPDFYAAIATTDPDKAADLLARESKRKGTYKDVDFWADADGNLGAVKGDFVLVAASEATLKRAIDVKEGKTLADDKRFKEAVEPLPDEREGTIYFDLKTAVKESGEMGAVERQIFGALFGGGRATSVAVMAEEDQLALESRGPVERGRSLATLFTGLGYIGATPLLSEVPGDAFASFGMPDFGETSKLLVNGLAGPLGGAVAAGELERDLGISLERDVYKWIGDVAVFARGASAQEINGGLLIEVRDHDAARRALPRLLGALQLRAGLPNRPVALDGADLAFEVQVGAPQPVFVALAKKRAVIALGRPGAEQALAARSPLKDADVWDRGESVLDGVDPAMLVDVPTILGMVEQAVATEPEYDEVRPYLETLTILAAGSEEDGDERRSRLAVGVK